MPISCHFRDCEELLVSHTRPLLLYPDLCSFVALYLLALISTLYVDMESTALWSFSESFRHISGSVSCKSNVCAHRCQEVVYSSHSRRRPVRAASPVWRGAGARVRCRRSSWVVPTTTVAWRRSPAALWCAPSNPWRCGAIASNSTSTAFGRRTCARWAAGDNYRWRRCRHLPTSWMNQAGHYCHPAPTLPPPAASTSAVINHLIDLRRCYRITEKTRRTKGKAKQN